MKRTALAGTFALIGGAATLLMVASILYSCRQGGHPHDMGNDPSSGESHSSSTIVEPPAQRTMAAIDASSGEVLTIPTA